MGPIRTTPLHSSGMPSTTQFTNKACILQVTCNLSFEILYSVKKIKALEYYNGD